MSVYHKNTIVNPNSYRQTQQLPATQFNQRNISKAATTRIYTEQLTPLYPLLNKSQVRAALVLTNNNLHECRLILDMKCKFAELRKSLNMSKLLQNATAASEFGLTISSIDARQKEFNIHKRRHEDVERCEGMRSIKRDNEKCKGYEKCEDYEKSEDMSSSLTSTSFSSMRSSSSSVYDFSDSESCIDAPMEWFEKKRNDATRRVFNKKVGVVIIRSKNGYRAFPL